MAAGGASAVVLLSLQAFYVAVHAASQPKPVFVYATELTADTFHSAVTEVVNSTSSEGPPAYFPLVMFHVSWCKHCQAALPEFESAAQMADQGFKAGQLNHLPAQPKFFVIECDTGPEVKALCDPHTGTSFPNIQMFRPDRSVRFIRPRTDRVFAWWAMHAARPMVRQLTMDSELKALKSGESLTAKYVALKADPKDSESVEAYEEAAFDFLEDMSFFVVPPSSEAARQLSNKMNLIGGDEIDPVPYTGEIEKQAVSKWVNFNRFAPVAKMSNDLINDLLTSDLPVVTFLHTGGDMGVDAVEEFAKRAKAMRTAGQKYLFAIADMSDAETAKYIARRYPLLQAPQIFVFQGVHDWWEDPGLVDAKYMTQDVLDDLLANGYRHDNSWLSYAITTCMRIYRFGTGSALGGAVVGSSLLAGSWIVYATYKALTAKEDVEDSALAKKAD